MSSWSQWCEFEFRFSPPPPPPTHLPSPPLQFKMVFMRSEKPIICAPSRLSALPLKRFWCSSDWRWSSLVLSSKISLLLSPSGDRWSDALGFVPAGNVSSSPKAEGAPVLSVRMMDLVSSPSGTTKMAEVLSAARFRARSFASCRRSPC